MTVVQNFKAPTEDRMREARWRRSQRRRSSLAEFSLPYVLSTPGGTITFNSGADTYYLQNVTGLDGAPIRAPIDNRPQAHGGLVHRALLGPRHITFDGMLLVTSAGDEAGYVGGAADAGAEPAERAAVAAAG